LSQLTSSLKFSGNSKIEEKEERKEGNYILFPLHVGTFESFWVGRYCCIKDPQVFEKINLI
jgi:hypothetical protein